MNSKFTFVYSHKSDCANDSEVIHTTDTSCLDDVLEFFTYFLRGCGFHAKGELDFIQEEELWELKDTLEQLEKSKSQLCEEIDTLKKEIAELKNEQL